MSPTSHVTSHLAVHLGTDHLRCTVGEQSVTVPVGALTLSRSITGDPPDPATLTNAIGLVVDHLDDVERELPGAPEAERVTLTGHGVSVLADVERGAATPLPFVLGRDAAEDLFRTVATESVSDRARNPGLTAEWVHDLLGTCCAVVGLMRHFALDAIELHDVPTTGAAHAHPPKDQQA